MVELKKRKIGVLMGGRSSEKEISIKSGMAVHAALIRRGYMSEQIEVDERLPEKLKEKGIEVAYIALHGRWGEDGTVQGLLEVMGIPYTGSGVLGSSISMDKAVMKMLLDAMKIPTPRYQIHKKGEILMDFSIPCVFKPANEGSTIGVTIVRNLSEVEEAKQRAFMYDRKLIVEEYVEGDEITVGIVNGRTLPAISIKPKKGFYDYEAKYTPGMTEYLIPAEIPEDVESKACMMAKKIYEAFELSGCVRIDMIVKGNTPYVIDVNTSPGMTETSLVPKAWSYMGGTFEELVEEILKGASLKL
ncbi:MAG: D-alanine--D-alanine ligase [Deltaproteobacteria bacterium]|nr:D-alanine--D-alanine ligase [Deltaproteobacteria bacterium]